MIVEIDAESALRGLGCRIICRLLAFGTMSQTIALMLLLVAPPATAQPRGRTEAATLLELAGQAATLMEREPTDLALAVARVNLSDEIVKALRTRPPAALKAAPRPRR